MTQADYTYLAPCPFCGAMPHEISVGFTGHRRWQHPMEPEECPIAGHMIGGKDLPARWATRVPRPRPGGTP